MITLHHRLVLNSDVVFRSGVPGQQSPAENSAADVVVTRTASRFPSLVLSPETAEFLLAFTSACPLSVAVQLLSKRLGAPAEEVLSEIYPSLRTFLDRGILVRTGRTRQIADMRRIGAWNIQRKVNDFDDSSVYLAKNDAGQFGALKLMRGASGKRLIEREHHVLEAAGSDLAPVVLDVCLSAPEPYLVTEWISGVVAREAFQEMRAGPRGELLQAAIRLVEAFESLHGRGILHGDIQPKNALFDLQGKAWILDFSHSHAPGLPPPTWRVGVPFFYEPEYAKGVLDNVQPPVALSLRGENYAIAALVFYLLSGIHSIEFSVERETMLRQIVETPARTLTNGRRGAWPSADAALRKYLAKNPAERPESLIPLRDGLVAGLEEEDGAAVSPHLRTETGTVARAFRINRKLAPERLIKEGFGLGSARLRNFDVISPRCSLSFGASGIAYALLRAAELCGDAEFLWAADAWIEQAEQHSRGPEAFTSERIELTRRRIGYSSLSGAEPGMFFVKSLIRAAVADTRGTRAAVDRFVSAATHRNSHAADVNLGGAGLALAADRLRQLPIPAEQKQRLGELRGQLIDRACIAAARSAKHRDRLGFAHGAGGMLFVSLSAGASSKAQEAAARLRSLTVMMRRGVRWPVRVGSDYFMHGWCNGVAGHLLTWTRMWQCSGEREDRDMMERAAWGVWESRMKLGNVCCGAGGQAAALAVFAQAADEPVWRKRAGHFIESVNPTWSKEDHPQSLFRGELGLLLVRLECEAGVSARFPVWGASLG